MVLAGMTPVQVIVAATRNGAEFLRIADAGTLEAGKSADFIVLDANPLDDITNTRKIASVVSARRRGRPLAAGSLTRCAAADGCCMAGVRSCDNGCIETREFNMKRSSLSRCGQPGRRCSLFRRPALAQAPTTNNPKAPVTGMKPDRTTAPAGLRKKMQVEGGCAAEEARRMPRQGQGREGVAVQAAGVCEKMYAKLAGDSTRPLRT